MSALGTVLSIFLLMFIGYGTKRIRLLRAEDADILNTVVVYLTIPAFIFEAIYSYRQPIPLSIVKVPIVGFILICVVLGMAYLIGRMLKLDRTTLSGLIIASGFGNTGFLGYPVVQAAFHEKGALVTAALYDEVAMALPLFTIGALIAAGFAGERVSRGQMAKVFTLPGLWAIPVALLLRRFAIPEPLMDTISYLSSGTIPLVMISLGLSLSASSLKGLAIPLLAACVLKLGVLPLATHYAIIAAGVTGSMHQVTVLEAGMPSALMTYVIGSKFGANGRFIAGAVFISTMLSIITIPATLLLLGR